MTLNSFIKNVAKIMQIARGYQEMIKVIHG